MSKAVLIIDMPENCIDCKFCREFHEGVEACCEMMDDPDDDTLCRMIDGYCHQKPNWCPLRKLPDKEFADLENDNYEDGYVTGWNNCLDIILKRNI